MRKLSWIMLIFLFPFSLSFAQENVSELAEHLEGIESKLGKIETQLVNSNLTNLYIIVISLSIALFALGVAVITGYYTRRTFQQSENEIRIRSRPWLTISKGVPQQVTTKMGGKISYSKWADMPKGKKPEIVSVKFWITIKNIGPTVARNCFKARIVRDTIFERNEFENVKETKLSELAPKQESHHRVVLDVNRFYELGDKNLFVGLSLSYENQNTRYYSGIILGIEKGGNYIVDSWYT